MNLLQSSFLAIVLTTCCNAMQAQNYKTENMKKAYEILGLQCTLDSIMPDTTYTMKAKDGRAVYMRIDSMGEIEQIGIPLFNELMRTLQPSPVYDFLEFAVINWKYKVNPNQLYLSKVIFKKGTWETLLNGQLMDCECSIENREDKLYIVNWQRDGENIASIGIPIEYELLNNDSRRNMERSFVKQLKAFAPSISRPEPSIIDDQQLSIYGTEGLFVMPGKSYLVEFLNQNVYYTLTTISETVDTVINNKPVTMTLEAVSPVVVRSLEYPYETMSNLIMCYDTSVPDVTIELDFHLSDYNREQVSLPLSRLMAFCRQNGCEPFFACDIVKDGQIRGVLFLSNIPRGYNHLLSIRTTTDQLDADLPIVKADVYLYIPPIDKNKLFGTAPTKQSGAKFKLK